MLRLISAAAVGGAILTMPLAAEVKLVDLPAPSGTAVVAPAPTDWPATQAARRAEKEDYLKKHAVAYNWFANFPFSQTDGIPLVILRLLPTVAPDIWGPPDAFGSTFGLFRRPDGDTLPLPVGIGVSGLDPKGAGKIDYTSFTCGACHIGRVRLENGDLLHIKGGVNAEFNVVKFFVDFEATLDRLGGETTGNERHRLITARFVQAAMDQSAANPHHFYGNAAYDGIAFDAAYEAEQVAQYLSQADILTASTVNYIDSFVAAFGVYLDKTYDGYQSQMLAGLPGMADATGVSAAHGYETLEESLVGRLVARSLLPDHPGLSDYMLVWNQDARRASWDSKGITLIDGGGQYNGNIPIPIYRNLAASMTMGLERVDLRVAGFAAELLGGLPPMPYPFDVNEALAANGQTLFARHCADCHQPNNGKVYRNISTSMSRSLVINAFLHKGAQQEYLAVCNPDTELSLYGTPEKPCATYLGRPISPDTIMRPLGQQHGGYNATSLSGIWAGAPYLHTGSVPTIYHLLVPNQRPDRFVKSALSYDSRHLGFAWQDGTEGGYVFDTTDFHAITKSGHDTDITMNGKTYRLNWSSDPEAVWAIIEYLKTL
jgi:hypothetical protein